MGGNRRGAKTEGTLCVYDVSPAIDLDRLERESFATHRVALDRLRS